MTWSETYIFNWFHMVSIQEYIENGGAVMILLGEGGENEFNTNLNFLLEDYGMSINSGQINT